MARIRVTALVAPYVDDITAKKQAGYTWSNIVDMLSDAGVIDKDTALMTLRNASINSPYAQYVEQRQIPIKQSIASETARPVPSAPRQPPVNTEPARYGIGDKSRIREESSPSTNAAKEELARMGLFFK